MEDRLKDLLFAFEGLDHDMGFLFLPSAVADWRATGNQESRRRGLHAANLLAGRFNMSGNFIRAWNSNPMAGLDNSGWMIIDCMMNIPLLYWASKACEDRFCNWNPDEDSIVDGGTGGIWDRAEYSLTYKGFSAF